MGLRSEYSLGHSQFNEFLFAFIGQEKSGQSLTVLSALARLGLDPWEEAARLSEMTKEAAASALTAAIAGLPEGDWKASDSRSIAIRLLDWLPRRGEGSGASPQGRSGEEPQPRSDASKWLVRLVFGLAVLVLIMWQRAG